MVDTVFRCSAQNSHAHKLNNNWNAYFISDFHKLLIGLFKHKPNATKGGKACSRKIYG